MKLLFLFLFLLHATFSHAQLLEINEDDATAIKLVPGTIISG